MTARAWYAAYGSNMIWRRFRHYLEGGVLAETGRSHQGARDPSCPRDTAAVWLPGSAYFATESAFWTGGRALYDPLAPGMAAGRAWLITAAQLCDIMAQEMNQAPCADLDLPAIRGESLQAGPGHYETLTCTGRLRGHPVITFCAPWRLADAELLAPAPGYRAVLADGLQETFGWNAARSAAYLASLPGGSMDERSTGT